MSSPYSIPFLSALHQNKALYNFRKRGAAFDSRTQYRSRICPGHPCVFGD